MKQVGDMQVPRADILVNVNNQGRVNVAESSVQDLTDIVIQGDQSNVPRVSVQGDGV